VKHNHIDKQIKIEQNGTGNNQENNFFLNPDGYSRKLEEDFTNVEIISKEQLRYEASRGHRLRNIGFLLLFGFVIALIFTSSSPISYGVLFIGALSLLYWLYRMEPYSKYIYLDSMIRKGNNSIYINDKYRFIKDDEYNYLIYDLTTNCVCDTTCSGSIQIVNAPQKEIEKQLHDPFDIPLVGICSLRKKKHSCRIDIDKINNEWFAVVAEVDWSEAEKK
jgi:hypothetical protein